MLKRCLKNQSTATVKLFKTYRPMKNNKLNDNIVYNVAERIVKFYCGLFSHSLSALKFQTNFPLDKKDRDSVSCSKDSDTTRVL